MDHWNTEIEMDYWNIEKYYSNLFIYLLQGACRNIFSDLLNGIIERFHDSWSFSFAEFCLGS